MPVYLNWEKIYSLPNEMHQNMVAALKHAEVFDDKVNEIIPRENGGLLVNKELYNTMTKEPLLGVVTSSKGLLQEGSDLSTVCTRLWPECIEDDDEVRTWL